MLTGDVVMTSGADRRATGDAATIDQRADTVLLTGNVVAMQGRNQLKGERLFVERAHGPHAAILAGRRRARSRAASPTRFYRGERERAQAAKQKVKQLVGRRRGEHGAAGVFKTDPTAPIDVEADRLDVDDHAKLAIFQRRRARRAGRLHRAHLRDARPLHRRRRARRSSSTPAEKQPPAQITRIEARGKVIVTSKNGQNATGDWADFDVKENKVMLGGDVVLTQEKNVVRGTRLVIDMVTGRKRHPQRSRRGMVGDGGARPAHEGTGFTVQAGHRQRARAQFFTLANKKDGRKEAGEAPRAAAPAGARPAGDGWQATRAPSR